MKGREGASLMDSMLSPTLGIDGKGFYLQVHEHYDIWHELKELEITDSDEKEDVNKRRTKFKTGTRGHTFDARDMIDFISLGMRLKSMGYDHIVASITRTRDELE